MAAPIPPRKSTSLTDATEEFAVILPEIDLAGAEAMAQRIRTAVMGWAMPHAAGPHALLTVSCGVASVPEVLAANGAALVAEADAALYAAKRAGRNQVLAAERSKAVLRLVS